jgi:hypothetical protein
MGTITGDRTKIKLGPHQVKFGGTNLGFTAGGVEITYNVEYKEIMVDQLNSPVDIRVIKENFEAKFSLSETSRDNLLIAMPAASAASGAASADGINFGRRPGYSVGQNASGILNLHPVDAATGDLSRDWTVPIAVAAGPVTIPFKPDEEQLIPIVMKAIADPAQEDSYHLFRYGY